jgi:hypothetical protein
MKLLYKIHTKWVTIDYDNRLVELPFLIRKNRITSKLQYKPAYPGLESQYWRDYDGIFESKEIIKGFKNEK